MAERWTNNDDIIIANLLNGSKILSEIARIKENKYEGELSSKGKLLKRLDRFTAIGVVVNYYGLKPRSITRKTLESSAQSPPNVCFDFLQHIF